jgi:hypothetical protein
MNSSILIRMRQSVDDRANAGEQARESRVALARVFGHVIAPPSRKRHYYGPSAPVAGLERALFSASEQSGKRRENSSNRRQSTLADHSPARIVATCAKAIEVAR